ncbi:hypothetical protein [Deinococcus sp. QL22]|uniref:hypothetical protein n=1 Tax=Deinococcus sp. QL22 TaxID=2939437 RepID=UPI002016BDF1|nr:hypothetical protein [Deinococcus sp. QL22]UQN10260.1 hypothetical protein M1R55_28200 [Deinococcus sp. QL22]
MSDCLERGNPEESAFYWAKAANLRIRQRINSGRDYSKALLGNSVRHGKGRNIGHVTAVLPYLASRQAKGSPVALPIQASARLALHQQPLMDALAVYLTFAGLSALGVMIAHLVIRSRLQSLNRVERLTAWPISIP